MAKTVLIVDDDALFREVIGEGLRAAGYTVAIAANGLEALERVREAPPDFILLDLIMPKVDGMRTCRVLKRHPQHRAIPVIILTGIGQRGIRDLDDLGAEGIVAKRDATQTLAEILNALEHLRSAPAKPPPPADAAPGTTDRRIVSELLAERQHIQTLLGTLGEGVVEIDDLGQVLYINPAGLGMLDRTEDEILGSSGIDLLGPGNAPAMQERLREVHAGPPGHTVRFEVFGGQKVIGVTLTSLRHPGGPPGALFVLRDLTDLTRRARSIEALAAVGQHILGKLEPAGVLQEIVTRTADLLGTDRCALFRLEWAGTQQRLRCVQSVGLSEHFARGISISPGEGATGRSVLERRPVHTPHLLQDPGVRLPLALRALAQEDGIGAVLATPILLGEEALGALTVYRPAGHQFAAEERELVTSLAGFAALALENARLYAEAQSHSQELERRVTERTRELQALNRELETASRHKSEFLANMSHELRTPLHSVLGFTDLLLGAGGTPGAPLAEEHQRYLQSIRANGERLLTHITEMLDLAKVEAGRMALELQDVPVPATLLEAAQPAKLEAAKKGLTLEFDLEGSPQTIVADPDKLQQILANLLSNAIKFTPGGGTITVTARSVPDVRGRALEVSVRDTGIGIAPEDHARLFKEFVQLDHSLAKRHQGSGLGLALTKRLVKLHDGRIWATSPGRDKGATFTFRIPCRQGPLTGKILVVEDDRDARTAIREILTARGLEVWEAVGGLEGLALIEQALPDVLVLDLHMPLTHGYQVIRNLRRRPETVHLPILVVTGLGPEDGRGAISQGADAFLTKPFAAEELLEAVERMLERRGGHAA